jgi:hypothetical protein
MKKISVEIGAWVQAIDSVSGNLKLGQLDKYAQDKPFDENNLCLKHHGFHYPIRLENIVRVFPKVILEEKEINPSKRQENES